jgi:clan AA aspartic protease (TIGR02281 family)
VTGLQLIRLALGQLFAACLAATGLWGSETVVQMPDFACHRPLRALIAVRAKLQAVGMIALLAGVGYGHQHSSVAAQLSDDHRLIGQFDGDYGCYISVMVDGVQFRMLVDTGSDDLAFSRSHLRKLGLNAKRLSYSESIDTSNGTVRSAPIVVHELRIGSFVLHDVQAVVDDAGADEPLLGMSVIKYMRLEIGRDGCELRW